MSTYQTIPGMAPQSRNSICSTTRNRAARKCEIPDPTPDSARYPATALLLEQDEDFQLAGRGVVTLAAATRRAQEVITDAVRSGDRDTAGLIIEAFSRLALHASSDPACHRSQSIRREVIALRKSALTLIEWTSPGTRKQQANSPAADFMVSANLSGRNNFKAGDGQRNIDEELAELLNLMATAELN